jgi:uncharacterized repeat protein (TIGR03803 family)
VTEITQFISGQALSLSGLSPKAQATAPLHQFTNDLSGNSDGAFPRAGLIIDATGALYGTTNAGGSNGYGTVFKLSALPPGYTARSTVSVSRPTASTDPTPKVA